MEHEFKVACNIAGCRGVFQLNRKKLNYVCQICGNSISKEIQEERILSSTKLDKSNGSVNCYVCNIQIPDYKEAYWIGNIIRPVCYEHKQFGAYTE